MALSISLVNPEVRYNPFTGIPELERQKSGIPRAEVIYSKRGATWPAPGGGNNRQLLAACNLDTSSNFGYVLTDCFATIRDNNPLKLSAIASVAIYPGGNIFSGDRITTTLISDADRSDSTLANTIGTMPWDEYNSAYVGNGSEIFEMIYRLQEPKPTGIIYPYEDPGASSLVNVIFGEEYNGGSQYQYDFYCRFLQYDVSQSYNYVVNTPQLMR